MSLAYYLHTWGEGASGGPAAGGEEGPGVNGPVGVLQRREHGKFFEREKVSLALFLYIEIFPVDSPSLALFLYTKTFFSKNPHSGTPFVVENFSR